MPSPDPVHPPAGPVMPAVRTGVGARVTEVDACPGALRLHDAADGPLARVRIPGGRISGDQLTALRELAAEWGDGHIELTSRANLQLRALRGAPAVQLAARLSAAGLLPSQTHELVRNIAASPLIGNPSLVTELDSALCADAVLAGLPGRFLFAVDSGAGDVAYSADVAVMPLSGEIAVLFAGRDMGLRVRADQAVPALLAAAHAFLALAAQDAALAGADTPAARDNAPAGQGAAARGEAVRGEAVRGGRRAWRVRELRDGAARVAGLVAGALGVTLGEPDHGLVRPGLREPVGIVGGPGRRVAVGALVPLGRLDGVQMKALESASDLVFTPWRGVVVPDLAPDGAAAWVERLSGAGFEVAPDSRWAGVTACAGRPGCAKALADVRQDAFGATTAGEGLPVHWIGCVRGCGSPAGPHVRVEATGTGYRVSSPHGNGTADAAHVGVLVAGLREG
ncbi:precorrin-3B synthase [Actinoplanes sp. NPDC051494]|uniref:precorrin-3B synthase n=1 Tax=Actinoplanes sp. NPDC051494 TaxID=3363907 RepID=UPI0037A62BF4